jgi:signal transduction histidine kinase
LLACIVGSAMSAIHRFRRSRGDERLQLKWLAVGAATTAFAYLATMISAAALHLSGTSATPLWADVLGQFGVSSFVLIPVAVGIAILKYNLYDIDVVINKTLVFGALGAFITAVYVAVVVGIGNLLGSSEEPNLALSIAATALVAIAFQPVKERVQKVANRIVYGLRATPYEVMANLSRAASGAVEPSDILPSVAAVAASGVGARATRVSLVLHSGEVLAATHPGELGDAVGYDLVIELTHRGESIGELAVAKAAGEQPSPGDRKLLEDLAAQAALALHNARLAIELGARLEEIREQAGDLDASRRRIVSAQDDSRRSLERDISSGPQRSLEQMRVELGAIREVMAKDPPGAAEMLGGLAGRANETLEALRDLARGIFPPLLADQGIVAALEAHIRKHELDLALEADEIVRAARFEERVESAVYFCCLEALSGRGDDTTLVLHALPEGIEMSFGAVSLDPGRLETIRDRVEALSGTVALEGRGERTTLRASFPAAVLEAAG